MYPADAEALPLLPFPAAEERCLSRIVLGGRFGDEDERLSFARLDRFVAAGGRFVDTAHTYADGRSETTIGRWNRHNPGAIVVVDKIGHPNELGRIDLTVARLQAEAEISLARLGLAAFDVVLLHRDNPRQPVEELVDTLADLVESKLAYRIGLSNWAAPRARLALGLLAARGLSPVVSYQLSLAVPKRPLWPGTLHADPALLDVIGQRRVPLLAWAGQARGYFTGSSEPVDQHADGPFDTPLNDLRRERCRLLARRLGTRPETVALAWSLHIPGVLPVVGARTLDELDASMAAATVELDQCTLRWLEGDCG